MKWANHLPGRRQERQSRGAVWKAEACSTKHKYFQRHSLNGSRQHSRLEAETTKAHIHIRPLTAKLWEFGKWLMKWLNDKLVSRSNTIITRGLHYKRLQSPFLGKKSCSPFTWGEFKQEHHIIWGRSSCLYISTVSKHVCTCVGGCFYLKLAQSLNMCIRVYAAVSILQFLTIRPTLRHFADQAYISPFCRSGLHFAIFNCQEISNMRSVHSGPAALSPLSVKARRSIHYPKTRVDWWGGGVEEKGAPA